MKYRIKTFLKYQDLVRELVQRDLKLKYRRSFLGYLWSVLNPLLIMIVLTVVFSNIFNKSIENFPVYLFTGRMLYDFLKASTTNAMKSVTGNAALLKKVYIPKYIFTFAKVTSCMVDMVLSMGALLIVMVVTRAPFYWQFLLCPVVILQLYIFCCGLGFLLAELTVFFRDIQYIYNVLTTAWMYLTPIFYPMEQLPESVQKAIKIFNPMYQYITQFRTISLHQTLPAAGDVVYGFAIAFVFLIVGSWAFIRKQDDFILYI
mgnify:CR=1 FL=1